MKRPIGLYIHIPFCPYRCHYCDFVITVGQENAMPDYVRALIGDLQNASKDNPDVEITSIYIGGGTPSLLDARHINAIVSTIDKTFSVKPELEISLESNPETLTREKLSNYRSAGINRLSIGVQSLERHHLERMGRFSNSRVSLDAFRAARSAGFSNINLDLLFGLPDQTLNEWRATLTQALSWQPEHLSAYGLQLETGTRFWNEARRGALQFPPDELQAQMYETLLKTYGKHKLVQYEISNFAREKFECRHNLVYWKNEEFLGIGLGAVSYIKGKRFWMTRNLKKYLSGEARVVGSESLPVSKRIGETLIVGLRLRRGVSIRRFRERFGLSIQETYADAIAKFRDLGLLELEGDRLFLTEKGLLISNEVLQAFV